tara:strand:+ start:868 stop:2649 length:1782 start_codon:yes stop_codon:yes gene_type:complete
MGYSNRDIKNIEMTENLTKLQDNTISNEEFVQSLAGLSLQAIEKFADTKSDQDIRIGNQVIQRVNENMKVLAEVGWDDRIALNVQKSLTELYDLSRSRGIREEDRNTYKDFADMYSLLYSKADATHEALSQGNEEMKTLYEELSLLESVDGETAGPNSSQVLNRVQDTKNYTIYQADKNFTDRVENNLGDLIKHAEAFQMANEIDMDKRRAGISLAIQDQLTPAAIKIAEELGFQEYGETYISEAEGLEGIELQDYRLFEGPEGQPARMNMTDYADALKWFNAWEKGDITRQQLEIAGGTALQLEVSNEVATSWLDQLYTANDSDSKAKSSLITQAILGTSPKEQESALNKLNIYFEEYPKDPDAPRGGYEWDRLTRLIARVKGTPDLVAHVNDLSLEALEERQAIGEWRKVHGTNMDPIELESIQQNVIIAVQDLNKNLRVLEDKKGMLPLSITENESDLIPSRVSHLQRNITERMYNLVRQDIGALFGTLGVNPENELTSAEGGNDMRGFLNAYKNENITDQYLYLGNLRSRFIGSLEEKLQQDAVGRAFDWDDDQIATFYGLLDAFDKLDKLNPVIYQTSEFGNRKIKPQ